MIVLDTHIWHWWTNQILGKLSAPIIELIEQADDVAVSAISCFEMSWLVRHGRIASLALTLPEHHKDLQDRLIIATAIIYYARLLSFDAAFPADQELNGRLINR